MQTILWEVKKKTGGRDGRTFRVFCANRNQIDRFIKLVSGKDYVLSEITNSIHNIKQFEQIIETLN